MLLAEVLHARLQVIQRGKFLHLDGILTPSAAR